MNGTTRTGGVSINPVNPGDRSWILVGAGDFDGDGDTDLLFQQRVTGELAIWFMHGTTLDTNGAVLTSPSYPG
ncbi:MAG TPA: hypothetical protein VGS41_00440 [Chthonomonadales bacterium]|nr:hypothetical protein [Chthonomonadales bacterium]